MSIPLETPTFIKALEESIYPVTKKKTIHIFHISLFSDVKVDPAKEYEIKVLRDQECKK